MRNDICSICIVAQRAKEVYNVVGGDEMGKASTRAQNKYILKTYDRINLTVPKGQKDEIKAHADSFDSGSVNAFINRAIKETMEKDKAKAGE